MTNKKAKWDLALEIFNRRTGRQLLRSTAFQRRHISHTTFDSPSLQD
jgi:hypothetical protein